jgi:hypothetical protein
MHKSHPRKFSFDNIHAVAVIFITNYNENIFVEKIPVVRLVKKSPALFLEPETSVSPDTPEPD